MKHGHPMPDWAMLGAIQQDRGTVTARAGRIRKEKRG
jgi:hypothetical protein